MSDQNQEGLTTLADLVSSDQPDPAAALPDQSTSENTHQPKKKKKKKKKAPRAESAPITASSQTSPTFLDLVLQMTGSGMKFDLAQQSIKSFSATPQIAEQVLSHLQRAPGIMSSIAAKRMGDIGTMWFVLDRYMDSSVALHMYPQSSRQCRGSVFASMVMDLDDKGQIERVRRMSYICDPNPRLEEHELPWNQEKVVEDPATRLDQELTGKKKVEFKIIRPPQPQPVVAQAAAAPVVEEPPEEVEEKPVTKPKFQVL